MTQLVLDFFQNSGILFAMKVKDTMKTYEVKILTTSDAWCAPDEWTKIHEVEATDETHAFQIALSRYCYNGTNSEVVGAIKES